MKFYVLRETDPGVFALALGEPLEMTAADAAEFCASETARTSVRHAVWPYDPAVRPTATANPEPVLTPAPTHEQES